MSALDNYEVSSGESKSCKKKLIHFSDGSTMEVEDDQDSVDKTEFKSLVKCPEVVHPSTNHQESSSLPSIDTKRLSWREWIKHYSVKSASSVMDGLDYSGETLAYYLGITSPKYQQEIEEYNRMVAKKELDDAEIKTWSSVGPSASTVRMEQIRAGNTNILLPQQKYEEATRDHYDEDEKV